MTAYALKSEFVETSLVIQGQRLCSANAGGLGLIPGQGTRSCMSQVRLGIVKALKFIYLIFF